MPLISTDTTIKTQRRFRRRFLFINIWTYFNKTASEGFTVAHTKWSYDIKQLVSVVNSNFEAANIKSLNGDFFLSDTMPHKYLKDSGSFDDTIFFQNAQSRFLKTRQNIPAKWSQKPLRGQIWRLPCNSYAFLQWSD